MNGQDLVLYWFMVAKKLSPPYHQPDWWKDLPGNFKPTQSLKGSTKKEQKIWNILKVIFQDTWEVLK